MKRRAMPRPPTKQSLSNTLHQQTARMITQQGPIPFQDFMQSALYTPQLGYYTNPFNPFNASGDFITAPELSPHYGACIATQCLQYLQALKEHQPCILEVGAGSGALAHAILSELHQHNALPERYFILEISASLKAQQRARLSANDAPWKNRVVWLDRLPDQPLEGVIIANEVLDAMPVAVFRTQSTHPTQRPQPIEEAYIDLDKTGAFAWHWQTARPELTQAWEAMGMHLPAPYRSEINLYVTGWIKSMAHSLKRGACILIDYGFERTSYYHPQRNEGTLMCHFEHRAHSDPLIHIGMQDITAHVDFTAVAEAAESAGFTLEGYCSQAHFLLQCGLLDRPLPEDPKQRLQHQQAIKKLTLPHEMGELFKVMTLSKGMNLEPLGHQAYDLCHKL
jgi:SAM-dependent MidA family methyltransferase